MTVGPLTDYHGYKALWHPYNGAALPYRLLYPKNYDSSQSYPLIITIGGGWIINAAVGHGGTDNLSHINESYERVWDPDNIDSPYHSHNAFALCPQITSQDAWDRSFTVDGGSEQDHPEYLLNCVGGDFTATAAVSALVRDLVDESVVWYEDSDTTNTRSMDPVHIDPDRVYFAGFSLGGKASFYLMNYMRDMLAGAVMMSGWPIGNGYIDYYRVTSDYYDLLYHNRLAEQIKRVYHIPLLASAGLTEGMWDAVLGMVQAYSDVCSENGWENNLFAVSHPGGHATALVDYLFEDNQYFDASTPGVAQALTTTFSGAAIRGVDWLFSLRKPATPVDPYPDLHADGWRIYGDNHYLGLYGSTTPEPDPKITYTLELGTDNIMVINGVTYRLHSSGASVAIDGGDPLTINAHETITDNLRLRPLSATSVELWRPKRYGAF